VPKPIKLLEGIGNRALIRSTAIFHTSTIYWSLWKTIAGWAHADLYFVPIPARYALPPNGNFGLSDWS